MFRLENKWIFSASDLVAQMECGTRTSLKLARAAGLLDVPEAGPDAMLALTQRYGEMHEQSILRELQTKYGTVSELPKPDTGSLTAIRGAADATIDELRKGVDVVYQGVFFDGAFFGLADFLIRCDGPGDEPRYEVYDTKLARSVKPGAVLQLAAYSEQLALAGFAPPERMHVWLGNATIESFQVAQILPMLHKVRADLVAKLEHGPVMPSPLWGASKPACSHCEWAGWCDQHRESSRDLVLVAGINSTQRRKLNDVGISTIDQLADMTSDQRPAAISEDSFTRIAAQAVLQVRTSPPEEDPESGMSTPVEYDVYDPEALSTIPPRNDGDVYFDMEGDPFLNHGEGLEYLFGAVTTDDNDMQFTAFWAHNAPEEKLAFEQFVDWVQARRAMHPDLHVYHYAAYEQTAMKKLAQRHGTRENVIDDWLRGGVFCDLYPIVRRSVRTSQPSYSIKYMEPLYTEARTQEVTNAGDSVAQYEAFCATQEILADKSGLELDETTRLNAEADRTLQDIADYNQFDCESLVGLVNWLRERAAENGVSSRHSSELDNDPADAGDDGANAELVAELLAGVPADRDVRDAEQNVRALIAAALDFHWREQKSSWWEHFTRLDSSLDDLEQDDSVTLLSNCSVGQWEMATPRSRTTSRTIRFDLADGELFPFKIGEDAFVFYDSVPLGLPQGSDDGRAWSTVKVTDITANAVELVEKPPGKIDRYDDVPVALAPGEPVRTTALAAAIRAFAERYVAHNGDTQNAALDLLRRIPPRPTAGSFESVSSAVDPECVVAALRSSSNTYLAVQGPPGTGKTRLGSAVIKMLVESGWRIGVTGQSHKVVENLLDQICDAGLDGNVVAKESSEVAEWTALTTSKLQDWIPPQPGGFVVGGTAWTFSRQAMLDLPPLDLLVIDEAGQFSLANTIAVSLASERLLLLGDPQQLPQVSQGSHPEPVDASALGHLLNHQDTIPPSLGYFLDTSWRMHEKICEPVSTLSYRGELQSAAVANDRSLDGVEPGIHAHPIAHEGCSVDSPQEVERVLELVASSLGGQWHDGDEVRELVQTDLIVVAPYNRQVIAIKAALAAHGLLDVMVGTVDMLQGQQAPVVIVSLTASSAVEIPRGIGFLLMRNRLNVAVSRAQYVCHVVYSPGLVEGTVKSVNELERIAGLLTLVGGR